MIRMLVLGGARGENDARPHPAQNAGQRDGMGRPDFEVGVSIEFNEFDRRAEECRGSPRFSYALLGLAMRSRFAARAHDEMRRTPYKRLLRDHPAATELDVIWMCAEGQHSQGVRGGAQYRLHPIVRSRPGGQK